MSEKDSQGVVYTKENHYYIVGTNQKDNNNAESTLGSITLPTLFKGIPVNAIGIYAFRESNTLKTIFVPSSYEIIREDAFSYTSALENVIFGDNSRLKELGIGAFFNSIIANIIIPKSVKTFGYMCYGRTRIESLFYCGIPKSINSIIFGTNSDSNFIAFPNHMYVNERFPYDKFGDFENFTKTNSCFFREKICSSSQRNHTLFVYFIIFLLY